MKMSLVLYLRFFLIYSNQIHDLKTSKEIRKNIEGISNLSKDRLINELEKFVKSNALTKLPNDRFSLELFEIISLQFLIVLYEIKNFL